MKDSGNWIGVFMHLNWKRKLIHFTVTVIAPQGKDVPDDKE